MDYINCAVLPVDEAYTYSERMIFDICIKFQKRHGGEFDEYMSTANLAFFEAWEGYDETKGTKFQSWLSTIIQFRLLDELRAKIKRDARFATESTDARIKRNPPSYEDVPSSFFHDFLSELSSDARQVVELLLDLPKDVEEIAAKRGKGVLSLRVAFVGYLRHVTKLPNRRLAEIWEEVASQLG